MTNRYSNLASLYRQAFTFTLLWFVILTFVILKEHSSAPKLVTSIPSEYLIHLCWLIYIVYPFLPSLRIYFNGNFGFFLRLFSVDLLSLCRRRVRFIESWLVDQMLCFAILFRDLAYCLFYLVRQILGISLAEIQVDYAYYVVLAIHIVIVCLVVLKMMQSVSSLCFQKDGNTGEIFSDSDTFKLKLLQYFFILILVIIALITFITTGTMIPLIVVISIGTIIVSFIDLAIDFDFFSIIKTKGTRVSSHK